MPIIDGPGMFKEGDEVPGVICQQCSAMITIGQDPGLLPKTFSATCPICGYEGRYEQADVQTITIQLEK